MRKIIPLFLLILSSFSCSILESKAEVEEAGSRFLDLIREQKFEDTMEFYHPDVWKNATEEDIMDVYKMTESKLGTLKTYDLQSWNIESKIGSEAGVYYSLGYNVEFELFSGTISLDLYKPLKGSKEDISLYYYYVNSDGFLQQDNDSK